jgi:hypothetical protein
MKLKLTLWSLGLLACCLMLHPSKATAQICNPGTTQFCCGCNEFDVCQQGFSTDFPFCSCTQDGDYICEEGGGCWYNLGTGTRYGCTGKGPAVLGAETLLVRYPFVSNRGLAILAGKLSSLPNMERMIFRLQLATIEGRTTQGGLIELINFHVGGDGTIKGGAERISLLAVEEPMGTVTAKFYWDKSPMLPTPHSGMKFAKANQPVETLILTGDKWSLQDANGVELSASTLRPWVKPPSCKQLAALKKKAEQVKQSKKNTAPAPIPQPSVTAGGN